MKRYPGLLAAGFLLLVIVHPAFAQTDREYQVLKKENESLKPEQAVIKKDLHEIRVFAQGFQAAAHCGYIPAGDR
jgi:hypothetical protein